MSVVTPTVLSDGCKMPQWPLRSIDIRREVNRIPSAEIVLEDGDPAAREFATSNADFFAPGKNVQIKLRWEGEGLLDSKVFSGKVVAHGVESGLAGSSLTVGLKDAAVKLVGPRRSEVFRKKTDHQIVGDILRRAGIRRGRLHATQPVHPEIVQYECSDWDFILSRADAQGLVVTLDDGKLSLARIETPIHARHKLEWGMGDILEFEMSADARHQVSALESIGWSARRQKLTRPSRAKRFRTTQGNLDGAAMARKVGFGTFKLSHPVPITAKELQAWADGRMIRSRMAMLRGRLAVRGRADIDLLDSIKVAGIGERFNGAALVTGIRHRLDHDGWRTDFQLGLSPEPYSQQQHILEAPAAGLLPAVQGLQIGVVEAFEEDPDKELRVRVLLPAVDQKAGKVWAKLLTPEGGKDRGFFFRPEKGDEVVVGFLNSDPRHPVILGALYGSKNKPPAPFAKVDGKNLHKGIVTKKKTVLAFVDEDKAKVYLETAQKNKILIDDEAKEITIKDQHGSSVVLSKDGIKIESAKDLTIKDKHGSSVMLSKDGIKIESGKDLSLKAKGKVEIKGAKVDVK